MLDPTVSAGRGTEKIDLLYGDTAFGLIQPLARIVSPQLPSASHRTAYMYDHLTISEGAGQGVAAVALARNLAQPKERGLLPPPSK